MKTSQLVVGLVFVAAAVLLLLVGEGDSATAGALASLHNAETRLLASDQDG